MPADAHCWNCIFTNAPNPLDTFPWVDGKLPTCCGLVCDTANYLGMSRCCQQVCCVVVMEFGKWHDMMDFCRCQLTGYSLPQEAGVIDFGKTCFGLISSTKGNLTTCYGLAMERHSGANLLQGKWCNGYWPYFIRKHLQWLVISSSVAE